MNIHGQIQGELMDITQDALCELRNAVFGNGTYMTNPVHEHYHDTLNNSDFLNSICEIKRKLDREFFMRDVNRRKEL